MRKLRVYGWQGHRAEAGPRLQTREIMAATSMLHVANALGYRRPGQVFNLSETGNADEIAKAMSEPGQIFWAPIDRRREWRKAGA